MSWGNAWAKLNKDGALIERTGQRALAEAVFDVTDKGGVLLSEAPVGVGKSFAYCIPLIYSVHSSGQRSVISTETTALQDQLVDKDLPRLHSIFGGFKFRSLKGRSWYLCTNKAPNDHWIIRKTRTRDLGDGERRDVERIIGYRVDDDEWAEVSGDADYCAANKCTSEKCYSARARSLAEQADIVVTNHALLRTNADMGGDMLGMIKHVVVDEAHTLEHVLIDGWGMSMSPYEMWKDTQNVWDGLDAAFIGNVYAGKVEEAQRLMKEGVKGIVLLFTLLYEKNNGSRPDDKEWRRESFTLSQQFLSGPQTPAILSALDNYELEGPGRFKKASEVYGEVAKRLTTELESMERGSRKIRKGITSAKRLSKTLDMIAEALDTRNGIVMRFGVPYVVVANGYKAWKSDFDVKISCVPLDISNQARETVWHGLKSVTLVSGTLRDEIDGSFTYVKKSLGLPSSARELVVQSTFDYATNQLIYVTPGTRETVQVVGARFSFEELVDVLNATNGRALVLFTANAEMEYAAESLRTLYRDGKFTHPVLVQEKGVDKSELVSDFMGKTNSVLLGSKSFFTGVDFPGESCSAVVLCKFPLPQYNPLCRARIDWWRGRGFPQWYEREAMQVFKQANGRLIRNEQDRGVIAILDSRASDPREKIHRLVGTEITTTGSSVTNNLEELTKWLQ